MRFTATRRPLVVRTILVTLGAVLVTIGLVSPLPAQDMPEPRSRVLNGHHFIPSPKLSDPFINTWVGQSTGAGIANDVVTQVENLDGDGTIELIGDVTFLGLGFGYQQAFNDWFAAYLTIGGGGRIGTSAEAILSSGLNAFVNLSLGGKFRLWRNQNFLLSARLDYASTGVSGISILDWGREIVDSGEFSDSLLVSKSSTGSARGGLNLSYAPRPWIGFTVLTLFGLGDNADDLETEFAFQGQIWTDIDLNLLTPVPIGFVLGYDRNSFVQQGGEIAKSIDAFIFGFFYTGRDDFSIGLEFQSANLPLRDVDASISTGEGTINLRYLF